MRRVAELEQSWRYAAAQGAAVPPTSDVRIFAWRGWPVPPTGEVAAAGVPLASLRSPFAPMLELLANGYLLCDVTPDVIVLSALPP